MHRERRASYGSLQVVHVNVGPERAGGAQSLIDNVLARQDAGYHKVIDDRVCVRVANDNELVYGARGCSVNDYALHYCLIGYADQTAAEWADAYSRGELTILAKELAADAVKRGIPIHHQSAVLKGQVGHHDVTLACDVSGGHTDPGPHFPWDKLMGLVRWYVDAPPQPTPTTEGTTMALRVAQPNKQGVPAGRTPFAELVPGHGIALLNGAQLKGESGPTPFGNWLVNTKPGAKELLKVEGGVVIVFNKDETHGPYFWK